MGQGAQATVFLSVVAATVCLTAAMAAAAEAGVEIAELDQWYSSVCPATGPDEATASITGSILKRIDRVRDDVKRDTAAISSELEDPDQAIERERGLMRAAISETRADFNGAVHELARMSVSGTSADTQAKQRLKVRAIKAKRQDLELHYAVGDYLEGVRSRAVAAAADKLSTLKGQGSKLEKLYENTRECQSVARGNIGDQDPGTGERLGVNEVGEFGGGGIGNSSGGSGR